MRHAEEIDVASDGSLSVKIMSDTAQADALVKALRQYPELAKFGDNIRVRRVYPFYMPDGMFQGDVHVLNADPDQLDFLVRRCPEYNLDRVRG